MMDLEHIRRAVQADSNGSPRPGLLIGKGPSYEKLQASSLDLSKFLTVGLNHVVARLPVDVASAIDLDVVADCGEQIYENAKVLAVPYHPHVNFLPSDRTLFEYFAEVPVLQKLWDERRLLVYNASTAAKLPQLAEAPNVKVLFFNAEAGYDLLALLGAREIFTVGVDGGRQYAGEFDGRMPLTNGRETFGYQFLSLNRKFEQTGIRFGPLDSESPIRIFVGCDETQYLASRVLEYSLYMNCDTAIQFRRIDNRGLASPKDPRKRARTPFSFARFKIPELCEFKGRGIYLDADMIVFSNIREIWEQQFDSHSLLYSKWGKERRPQFSVMVLDCEALQWSAESILGLLERDDVSYEDVMDHFKFMDSAALGPLLSDEWNSLEFYEPGKTKLLHYTDMDRQPWVTDVNENASIFYDLLRSAIAEGFISKSELEAQVLKGHVSPELPDWLGLERPRGAPDETTWVPPYKRIGGRDKGFGPALNIKLRKAGASMQKSVHGLFKRSQ